MKHTRHTPDTPPQNVAVELVGRPRTDLAVPPATAPGTAWSHCHHCGTRLTFHPVPSALLDWLTVLEQDLGTAQDHLSHLKQILEEAIL